MHHDDDGVNKVCPASIRYIYEGKLLSYGQKREHNRLQLFACAAVVTYCIWYYFKVLHSVQLPTCECGNTYYYVRTDRYSECVV